MFTKTKKSILAIAEYWCMAPYLISFKTWIAPFIERKSHFVKGAFPLQSNDNDKGPLIHDQNWKSSFHIVAIVVSRTKSLFLYVYLKMWSTIFLLLFRLELNVWNRLAGKFLQPNRGFFFFLIDKIEFQLIMHVSWWLFSIIRPKRQDFKHRSLIWCKRFYQLN